MTRGRPSQHNIDIQRVTNGWVARWYDGENNIVCWSRTRRGAYSKAYRFVQQVQAERLNAWIDFATNEKGTDT